MKVPNAVSLLLVIALAASGSAVHAQQAQSASAGRTVVRNTPDSEISGAYRAHLDVRGCGERVRESESPWMGSVPAILWSGSCAKGLREGPGTLKLFRGRELLVASRGAYVNGFRIGPWTWEYPDGRRLEAKFTGEGSDPVERVFETAEGARVRQVLQGSVYFDDPGVAPPPVAPSPPPLQPGAELAPAERNRAAIYASAQTRVSACSGRGRIDPRLDFAASRRDVDLFVREGEASVRAEAGSDLRLWGELLLALAVRAGAYATSDTDTAQAARARLADHQDRYRWAACHVSHAIPYLSRMLQVVPFCESLTLFRVDAVRSSANPRLQATFAQCIYGEIHAARWPR